jgi:hypothetical protein
LEQLELVLKRAGSAELSLNIEWPVEAGALKLISSHKCPIHSLKVWMDPRRKTPFVTKQFMKLNVEPLKLLRISNIHWKDAKRLMDLALRSSRANMTLDIHNVAPTLDLFKHDFMDRVVNLELSGGE